MSNISSNSKIVEDSILGYLQLCSSNTNNTSQVEHDKQVANCLEWYYTICLQDVFNERMKTKNQNMNVFVCNKLIEEYTKKCKIQYPPK
jgi:hypothetical protein